MMTVKDVCGMLEFGEGVRKNVSVVSNIGGQNIDTRNIFEMAAYGDFVVDYIHICAEGVELFLKQEFVKAGA